MKVVLFCGGQGLRLREYGESLPKPMVPIGMRPVLWHVMRYYAHFGYNDFILCLGYRGEVIKDYFLRYSETLSNDFVLSDGGRSIELLRTDIQDWRITFVDTGLQATIASRLKAVRRHLEGEEMFLANYADVLTDAPLDKLVTDFAGRNLTAGFLSIHPNYTFHVVSTNDDGLVTSFRHVQEADLWVNGGYFMFRQAVFDEIREGDELVEEPFRRLVERDQLIAYRYEGFWEPMDTLKEMQHLEALHAAERAPWEVWHRPGVSDSA